MKTTKLEAILECDVRVVSITKVGRFKRVQLEVDGEIITLKEGDTSRVTLRGAIDRERSRRHEC